MGRENSEESYPWKLETDTPTKPHSTIAFEISRAIKDCNFFGLKIKD